MDTQIPVAKTLEERPSPEKDFRFYSADDDDVMMGYSSAECEAVG